MNLKFPGAVPEIPVSDLKKAAAYYVSNPGFSIAWGGEDGGIARESQKDTYRDPTGSLT